MSREVKLEIENKNGFFYIKEANEIIAEMTFELSGNNKIKINHTEVDEAYGGQGFAKAMLEKAVSYARENHLKIIPLCSFVKGVLEKDSTYNDVL